MSLKAPGPRVLGALSRLGMTVVAVQPLPSARRTSWRLRLDSGEMLRLRRLPSTAAAVRIAECLGAATPGVLPAPRGLAGRWLVTEYVPSGAATAGIAATRPIARVARLLAAIHASPQPSHQPTAMAVYTGAIARAAGRLRRAGRLTRAQASQLRGLARPTSSPAALTHGDLSAVNLVIDRHRRLRAIDEERVAVRPLAYDLARTICLWQMSAAEERRFLREYERAGGVATSYRVWRPFWIASALSTSVLYRMRYRPSALQVVVRGIRALARSCRDRAAERPA